MTRRRVILRKVAGGADKKLRALVEFSPVVGIVALAEIGVQLRGNIEVHTDDIVAARMRSAARRLEVILQVLRSSLCEDGIRKREEIEHRLAPAVDPVLGNDVPRERGRSPAEFG